MNKLVTIDQFTKRYKNYNKKYYGQFLNECKNHPYIHLENAKRLGKVFFNTGLDFAQSVPVVALRMGLGKSTLLHEYIQFMTTKYNNYGALIAVERVDDIKKLCEQYPNYFPLYGFRKDECVRNISMYNPNICNMCDEVNCHMHVNASKADFAPILVITHARLNLMMQDKYALANLLYYTHFDTKSKFRRRDLFVDECPGFFVYDRLNVDAFKILQNSLHSTYRRNCTGRKVMLQYFQPFITALVEKLQDGFTGFYETEYIMYAQERYGEFLKFKRLFSLNNYGAYYQLCINTIHAIQYGGIIQDGVLHTARDHELQVGDFRTFILDGTAHINKMYPKNTMIVNFEEERIFSNMTLTIDTQFNLSKTKYYDKPELVGKLSEKIQEQLEHHNKILVVTFKDLEESYKQYFTQEQLERIYIDHFNNLKGKNQYNDATCMVFCGNMYKGDIYYLLFYKFYKKRQDESVDIEEIEFVNTARQRIPVYKSSGETCAELLELINLDKADSTVQEGFRTQIRSNEETNAEYFMFSTNDKLVKKIEDFYPGAVINFEKIVNLREDTDEYKHFIQSLKDEFVNKESGYSIKKKIFREKYNILTRGFSRYLKYKKTQTVLQSLFINTSGHSIKIIN